MIKIESRKPEELVPYINNPKKHSADQIAQICASILEFGFTNPILIDDSNVVIAGHGRLMGACELKLEYVPVVVLGHLNQTQQRALLLADNRIAENATWDEVLLQNVLAELQSADFDLALTGFGERELAELLEGIGDDIEGNCTEIIAELPVVPISKLGEVYILGDHRLVCGDATDPSCYEQLLGNEKASMTFTDPPYNVDYANSAKDKLRGRNRAILNDNLGDGFHDFLLAAFTPMLACCDGAVYVAMSSSELDTLQAAFRAAGGHFSTFIIWAKNTFTLGRSDYQRQYEPILYGWREGAKRHWCGDRDQCDVWNFNKPHRNDLHPTMKPTELVGKALINSSRTGDIVLDPFGGSGTTMIISEQLKRRCMMAELDPRYIDTIILRWQEFTGKKATRESDGVEFNSLKSEADVFEHYETAGSVPDKSQPFTITTAVNGDPN